MGNRRAALRSMGAVMLLFGARDLAFGASIVAVRVWPAADYTRITIESDAPLAAKHFLAEAPSRLVIDIDGLELSPALREIVGKVRADDPFIAGVRVGQNQPRVVRLVIDLKQPTAPQVFTLNPVAAYNHRLVFDLYPSQARDPLLQLIRDKESAERVLHGLRGLLLGRFTLADQRQQRVALARGEQVEHQPVLVGSDRGQREELRRGRLLQVDHQAHHARLVLADAHAGDERVVGAHLANELA